MKAFAPYRSELAALLDASVRDFNRRDHEALRSALDGQPARQLRQLAGLAERRRAGAFFTGPRIRKRFTRRLRASVSARSLVYDPTCGAGDLLLACTPLLPVSGDAIETIDTWAKQLFGRDLHREFVLAAQIRLALAALDSSALLGRNSRRSLADRLFNIRVGCGLSESHVAADATHIVMNPPFTSQFAPDSCDWASGTVNAAALFLEAAIKSAQAGTRLLAVLPDVLRSGARYEHWRRMIAANARSLHVDLLGQFDRWTDVDVFLLDLMKAPARAQRRLRVWKHERVTTSARLRDYFDLSVGPVVEYRDPKRGEPHPFLQARDTPPWSEIASISTKRRFTGRLVRPPFLVVRRTSRKGDKARAIASIVRGRAAVAVENHLLILRPKDGTVVRCSKALKVLRHPETSSWLDRRIRCRHLTVGALADVPWAAR